MPMYPGCNWLGSGECPNLAAHLKSLQNVRLVDNEEVAAIAKGQPTEVIDPRWAALLELENKQRNNSTDENADENAAAKKRKKK